MALLRGQHSMTKKKQFTNCNTSINYSLTQIQPPQNLDKLLFVINSRSKNIPKLLLFSLSYYLFWKPTLQTTNRKQTLINLYKPSLPTQRERALCNPKSDFCHHFRPQFRSQYASGTFAEQTWLQG